MKRKLLVAVLVISAILVFGCAQKEAGEVVTKTTPTPTPTESKTDVQNLTAGINDTFKDIITEMNQIQELEKTVQELNTLNFEI